MTVRDPFADMPTTDVPRPAREDGNFWKPTDPEILVGFLERIDKSKYGEFGVFTKPVILRAADFRPINAPDERCVPFSAATLTGMFDGTSQGKFFRINFTGWGKGDSGNRFREYTVQILGDGKAAAKLIDAARAKFAADLASSPLDSDEDLPF